MLRALMLQGILLFATATAVLAVEVERLPGYSKLTVSEEFVEYLNSNKSVVSALEKDTDLSRLVMTRAVLQKQLMAKEISLAEIEKSYFPHRHAKADDAKAQDNMFITDAADITQRAITNTRRTANTQRAQKDIEEALDSVVAADGKAEAPQPNADNNLSAVPAGDAVDANGWPVAMNVPADCPARAAATDYVFNPKQRRSAGHSYGKGEQDRIHGFFAVGNGQVVLVDGQEQVAPFVTANTEGQQPVVHGGGGGSSAYSGVFAPLKVAYAYCPGDFNNTTPAGEVALNAACVEDFANASSMSAMVSYAGSPERAVQNRRCHLEPNKRYFANIRVNYAENAEFASCADAAKQVDTWRQYLTQANGKEVGICARLMVGGVHSHANNGVPAPYTGNCLNGSTGVIGKGLYPLNYTDLLCHGAEVSGNDTGKCANSTASDYHYTCYDPTGKNQPREYVNQCVGNQRLWTKGHMLETPSEYLCEVRNVNSNTGAVSYGQGTDGPAAYAVCAAHNEGRVRQRACTRGGVGYADGTSQEQCQFIAARGRYDWVEISTQGDRQHVNGQGDTCKYTFVENAQLPNGCNAGGKTHAVGTKKTITCNKGRNNETTHVSECRVQGEGFAPAFVAVSGSLGHSRCEPAIYN